MKNVFHCIHFFKELVASLFLNSKINKKRDHGIVLKYEDINKSNMQSCWKRKFYIWFVVLTLITAYLKFVQLHIHRGVIHLFSAQINLNIDHTLHIRDKFFKVYRLVYSKIEFWQIHVCFAFSYLHY